MAQILKVLQLAHQDRMAKMQIGSSGVEARLHAQRFTRLPGRLQALAQVSNPDNLSRPLLQVSKLFLNREKFVGHVFSSIKPGLSCKMGQGTSMQGDWNIDRLRADTAGCEQAVFFNNAGASLQPRAVVARVVEHLRLEEQIGGYEAADAVAAESAALYDSVARLLHCAAEEIALQESATRAWQMAFYALRFAPGDRIVTTVGEYASNYIGLLQVAHRTGAEICVAESNAAGEIDLEALKRLLDQRVKLVALTYVPSNSGLVQPAAAVGQLTRAAGIPLLIDACQAAGQIDLDVNALQCDMLCATGRKYLRGPRGTGFLYVRRAMLEAMEPAVLDMRAADWVTQDEYRLLDNARRFETWESSAATRLGLGVAIEYALALGLGNIERRVQTLAALLRGQLAGIPGVIVQDPGQVRCGIVTFTYAPHAPVCRHAVLAGQPNHGAHQRPCFHAHRYGAATPGSSGESVHPLLQYGGRSRTLLRRAARHEGLADGCRRCTRIPVAITPRRRNHAVGREPGVLGRRQGDRRQDVRRAESG